MINHNMPSTFYILHSTGIYVPLSLQFIHSTIHLTTHSSMPPLLCLVTIQRTLPLLPAEVIPTSKHHKKAKNGEEDDSVSCHHQTTGTPLDSASAG